MKGRFLNAQTRLHGVDTGGFTLVEVVVATALVVFALAGIFAMHGQSMDVMQSAKDSSSASQILQQRIEQLRMNRYDTLATSNGMVGLMNGAAGATNSEREMVRVSDLRESVTISAFPRPGVNPPPVVQSFTVTRAKGVAIATTTGDLRSRSPLKADFVVTWSNRSGAHRRQFATIISDVGISSGVSSKPPDVSQPPPGAPSANPPPNSQQPPGGPPASPPPNPAVCRHGRAWPHCGQP